MNDYISAEELIETAKIKGINLGKGDPYNRLRYYTKIGWLPHMERMKNQNGEVVGHYPIWTLDRISLIEKLKEQGKNNIQIEKEIKSLDAKKYLEKAFGFVSTNEKRTQLVTYLSFGLITLIVLLETGLITGPNTKQELINQIQAQTQANTPITLESGNDLFPTKQKSYFVIAKTVSETSKINVTFEGDFSPATRYWVAKKDPNKGFYLEVDIPINQATKFSWFITE